jgi:LysM repeat protein
MSALNPFQIPACYQTQLQICRRERFKNSVIITMGAFVVLFVVLLIAGNINERSHAALANSGDYFANQSALPVVATTLQPPVFIPQPTSVATQPVAVSTFTAQSTAAETIYAVKSGDTLIRIAKRHRTTVKAIKSANDLSNDRIVVGAKLRIPTA